MTTEPAPKCPKCGRTDGKSIAVKDGYLNDPPHDGEQPVATATVYLCSCGEAFTHLVTRDEKGSA